MLALGLPGVRASETTRAPSFEGVSVISKSGAEGQSRTDTGSPPLVFGLDAMPRDKCASVLINSKSSLELAHK